MPYTLRIQMYISLIETRLIPDELFIKPGGSGFFFHNQLVDRAADVDLTALLPALKVFFQQVGGVLIEGILDLVWFPGSDHLNAGFR